MVSKFIVVVAPTKLEPLKSVFIKLTPEKSAFIKIESLKLFAVLPSAPELGPPPLKFALLRSEFKNSVYSNLVLDKLTPIKFELLKVEYTITELDKLDPSKFDPVKSAECKDIPLKLTLLRSP